MGTPMNPHPASSEGTDRPHAAPHRRRSASALLVSLLALLATLATLSGGPASATTRRRTNDYGVRILADEQLVAAGGTATYPVELRVTSGFRGAVLFDVQGLPGGVSYDVLGRGNNRFDLVVRTPSAMRSSSTVAVLNARSSGRVRQALFRLTVNGAPEPTQPPPTLPPVTTVAVVQPVFDLRPRQTEASITNNQTAQYFIDVDRPTGYAGNVSFAVGGLPANVKANFAPNPTTSGTVLYISSTDGTPSGAFNLTVSASAAGVVRTIGLRLNVNTTTDFALTATPAVLSVAPGGRVVYTIDVRPLARANVSLDVAGLPAGAAAQLGANPTNKATTLTVRTSTSTPAGSYTLVVTGRSGSFLRQASVVLTVQGGGIAGFGLAANPAAFDLQRGGTASTFVSITTTGGFSNPVAMSVQSLPLGVSATLQAEGTGTRVTFYAQPNSITGQARVRIVGTSGTLTASIEVVVNIV